MAKVLTITIELPDDPFEAAPRLVEIGKVLATLTENGVAYQASELKPKLGRRRGNGTGRRVPRHDPQAQVAL